MLLRDPEEREKEKGGLYIVSKSASRWQHRAVMLLRRAGYSDGLHPFKGVSEKGMALTNLVTSMVEIESSVEHNHRYGDDAHSFLLMIAIAILRMVQEKLVPLVEENVIRGDK